MHSSIKYLSYEWAVLEHKTNGERSVILWDCKVIRDNTALQCGLVWIDRSSQFDRVDLVPRLESSPIVTITFPDPLKGLTVGQIMADVIFKIESII